MDDTGSVDRLRTHYFLGDTHEASERKTWSVIWLCTVMMAIEIAGGLAFGSLALVADGLHMSTHAGALLLAALAYTYARKHADDDRFSFGTGKFGDLAGFASAIMLAMIAVLIGYEAVIRILAPVPIRFAEAIPIACLGLVVNVASAWLLSGDAGHAHGHSHSHSHAGEKSRMDGESTHGQALLEIIEDGVPPRFCVHAGPDAGPCLVTTVRPDGSQQDFAMLCRHDHWVSADIVPEPHAFRALLQLGGAAHDIGFEEHAHPPGSAHRDNNMRAALVHVMADAAVSVLVIVGLLLARSFGWAWMDPLAGLVGAAVIGSWSLGLIRDTGAILLDMNPDRAMADSLRRTVEDAGDRLADLHLWRLGPGHLGAILSVHTGQGHGADFYRARLARFPCLSHVTIEIEMEPSRSS